MPIEISIIPASCAVQKEKKGSDQTDFQSWVMKGTYLFGCISPNAPFNTVCWVDSVKREAFGVQASHIDGPLTPRRLNDDLADSDIWDSKNQSILINLSTHMHCRIAHHLVQLSMGKISPSTPGKWKTLMDSLRWLLAWFNKCKFSIMWQSLGFRKNKDV